MRPETWLDALLGSRAKVRLLRLFSSDLARVWTERELALALGMSPNTVNLAVRALRDEGIIDFRKVGLSHAVRLRAEIALAKSLAQLFELERGLAKEFLDATRRVVPAGASCYLFGSTARRHATSTSDVDLLVVATTRQEADEVASKVRAAADGVLPTSLEIITLDRAGLRRRKKGPFIQNILREGIPISTTRLEDLL